MHQELDRAPIPFNRSGGVAAAPRVSHRIVVIAEDTPGCWWLQDLAGQRSYGPYGSEGSALLASAQLISDKVGGACDTEIHVVDALTRREEPVDWQNGPPRDLSAAG